MNTLPKKHIGIIGLGKMGSAIALHLDELGWDVSGYDISTDTTKFATSRIKLVKSLAELTTTLSQPRIIWLMVPAGEAVQNILFGKDGLINHLGTDDIVIDGGNSYFEDSVVTAQILFEKKINFLDVGVSNGV
ncbi:MAG: hypothetical protein RLY61_282, partial [Candidatus Parcubacteria bacterium]